METFSIWYFNKQGYVMTHNKALKRYDELKEKNLSQDEIVLKLLVDIYMSKPLNYYGFAFQEPGAGFSEDFLKTKDGKKAVENEIKRNKKYQNQLKERGFDDTECWNLDEGILRYALPRIKRLKEIQHGFPCEFKTIEEWNDILDKIIWSFEEHLKYYRDSDTSGTCFTDTIETEELNRKVQEGFELFGKHLRNLWD